MKFSKWIVALVILLKPAFTVGALFYRIGTEPTALIGACSDYDVELWAMAG